MLYVDVNGTPGRGGCVDVDVCAADGRVGVKAEASGHGEWGFPRRGVWRGRMGMEDRGPEGEVREARRVEVVGVWRRLPG